MSGIAGIVNFDGAPVDRDLLGRMASFLSERGADGSGKWEQGGVALIYSHFATTEESRGERQPLSLDGRTWIVADARIDGREDLVRELRAHGREGSTQRPDAELILHAYAVWGESCVEHLLGDFAFAIWDGRERKLFCARDHFGVRPFFYARIEGAFIFSNAMDVPRLHPRVPDDLNEASIADFLVFGGDLDLGRTVRAAIRHLPPAHVLMVAGGDVRMRRYWTLPIDPPTVFRRSRDYVERFLELFEQAVADRMRTDRVAVLMSGGMDSSSVAAMAKHVTDRSGSGCALSGHTQSFHHRIRYDEGRLASLVCRKIRIPWREFPLDDEELLGFWDQPAFRRAEPELTPLFDWTLADSLGKPLPSRVVLTGQGGDGVFSSLRLRHCRDRLRKGEWLLLGAEVCRYLQADGRLRRLEWRGHLRALLGRGIPDPEFPGWLNPDLERRLHLRERYMESEAHPTANGGPKEAVRPEAHALMSFPMWAGLFEEYDPDNAGGCFEARHPFFDLRLVRYVLSLPAMPWCSDKELLRRSMRGRLPEEVRLRNKQPIVTDLLMACYRASRKPWLAEFEPVEGLDVFVNVQKAMELALDPPPWRVGVHLRPISLNYWLRSESDYEYKLPKVKEEFRANTYEGALPRPGAAQIRHPA